MAGMERYAVNSSVAESLAYDATSKVLKIWYKCGELYEFYDVPQHTFETLLNAESKGYFINWIIKPAFKHKRVQ